MMITNIPNLLTLSRIFLIPVLALMLYFLDGRTNDLLCALLFAIACFTDFLDGYLARTYSIQSKLGALLDPIADKLLVSSVILILVAKGKIDILPSLAIICREILVSGLREFLATLKVKMPVTGAAKFKTAIQMFALFLLVIGDRGAGVEGVDFTGNLCLWLAAILTIATGYIYLRKTIDAVGSK